MAHLIISTDLEPVNVQVFGNWFSFKPGQIKSMDPRIVDYLDMDRKSLGFVSLPDVCAEDPTSEEAKKAVAEAIERGRGYIMQDLQKLVHNLEISLQKDYDRTDHKVSATHMEGKAHLPAYRKLAAMKAAQVDTNAAAIDEINKLKGVINGDAQSTNTGSTNTGS